VAGRAACHWGPARRLIDLDLEGDQLGALGERFGHDPSVVLTSDHGHVVDRRDEGRLVRYAGVRTARWRMGDEPPAEGEVALKGPRVQADEQKVVVPWDERLRYGTRRDGYHGGASLAEVAVPVHVLVPTGQAAPGGWRAAGEVEPAWWTEPVVYDVVVDAGGEGTLFEDL
jgi:hypothetical protein